MPANLPSFDRPMSPAFAALFDKIEDRYDRSFLRRLFSFCSSLTIDPGDADEATLAGFAEAVVAAGIDRPKQVVREAAKAWNRMAETIDGWPARRLSVADNRGWVALPMSAFPESFGKDCEAFLNRSEGLGLFDSRGLRKLSDVTRIDRRHKLRQLATRLVDAGRPTESIKRLADLVEPQAVESILLPMWNNEPISKTGHASNLARLMALIAQHWAFRTPEEIKRIKAAEANLRPPKQGMTDRNRAKLRQLMDPQKLRSLVNLPYEVVEKIDPERPTVSDAVRLQAALAVALLLIAPMREKNLASLDVDRHVHRVNERVGYVVIPRHEVKNERDLEYPLSRGVLRILDLYVGVYRPLLLKGAQSSKLFVSWNGRQKRPHELGAQVPKLIRERLGIDVNLHLFRHLAGYVFLSRHPGEYETVRQLLGHRSLATTIAFYTGLERADSFRRYDEILERHREEDHADA